MRELFWPYTVIAITLLLFGAGFGVVGALIAAKRPQTVHCAISPAELDAHPYICLALKDSYVCNMDGMAVTYAKDGTFLPAPPKTVFMPNTGPLKIK